MKGKTRSYNNQWLIKASNHIELTLFNLYRIHETVIRRGKYPVIIDNINKAAIALLATKRHLTKIQDIFNDSRANRIEVE